jgi:hypothetical protein
MSYRGAMTRKINELNKKWKDKFLEKRVEWVTTMNHEFLNYLENFKIKDVFQVEGGGHYFYIQNEDHYIYLNLELPRRVWMKGENENQKFEQYFKMGKENEDSFYQSIMQICNTMELYKIGNIRDKVLQEEFKEKYKDYFKGEIQTNAYSPKVIIDDYPIDISEFYKDFKRKKLEEKHQKLLKTP